MASRFRSRPKVFDTLLFMVEHHDGVLDKERIMEAVWPDSIVEENNLAQAIWKLRQVFEEKPGSHNYIVTVPGRGYRFVAEVTKRSAPPTDEITQKLPPPALDELRPEGIGGSGETKVAEHRLTTNFLWRWVAAVAAILVLALLALFFLRDRSPRPSAVNASAGDTAAAPAHVPDKSIAVLPFENRSRDPDNAYFADSIQDEILTRLAKIGDLKVISRTSTQHYKSAPTNLPEIAKATWRRPHPGRKRAKER